jgi:8-oxo-dGTP pyrophosphatase MutT (NUDIX family)
MMTEVIAVYAGEEAPTSWQASIFLAGPTPRATTVASWRPAALAEIERQTRINGRLVVFIPEPRDGARYSGYDHQVAWETRYLAIADVILFWIPRQMETLPGLTTNVEFGRYEASGRLVLGSPPTAQHLTYLQTFARQYRIPICDNLVTTVATSLEMLGDGVLRRGAETEVPLLIWQTSTFGAWLQATLRAGNRLRGAQVLYVLPQPKTRRAFLWVLAVQVWVAAEKRIKSNEVLISRPDLACVVAYFPGPSLADYQIVLVREFRAPSLTGSVLELPGGSGAEGVDPAAQAAAELAEEAGLTVNLNRLRTHGARQPLATFSVHRQHVFSLELTTAEFTQLAADHETHGLVEDSEYTQIELVRYGDLFARPEVDWTTRGVLSQVLGELTFLSLKNLVAESEIN